MNKKKILFIHQNFPGQFKSLAPALNAMKDIEVRSLSLKDSPYKDIEHFKYTLDGETSKDIHFLAQEFETKMLRAHGAALKCLEMKEKGYIPDLIISHPGWGETFLVKEIWPEVKILSYFEFYYHSTGSDVDFDPDEKHHPNSDYDLFFKLAARNAPTFMNYVQSDKLICPTEFQRNTAPDDFRDKIEIIHDGIDTSVIKPQKNASITLGDNNKIHLTKDDKVITFINRNLEPYRGYHIFMKSLPAILKKHPDAYVIIVGGDKVSYGASPEDGRSYKNIYFDEVKDKIDDLSRIKFVGLVEYKTLIAILGITTVHIYFTYPFVLSWSTLESMAMETLIIGSSTEPVTEVIEHNKNGILVDFFDIKGLSKTVIDVLNNPNKYSSLKKEARKTIIKKYDLEKVCLPKQIKMVESLLK